jgi:transglutaminase-like putative cysteine protease
VAERALVAFVWAAVAAFALSRREPIAWALAVPCLLGAAVRIRSVPSRVRVVLEYTLRGLAGLVVVFGLAWSLYLALPEAVVRAVPAVAGYAFALLAPLFLAGRGVWPPARTAVPAALGALVVALLDPLAPLRAPVPIAMVAGLAYLALDGRPLRPARLTAFAGGAGALAVGIVLFLPWAQPHVEQAVADALEPRTATTAAAFSTTSRLGSVEEVALSSRVVLRVWTAAPQRLRARVFTRFDGTTWHADERAGLPLLPVAQAPGDLAGWLAEIPGQLFVVPGREVALASSGLRMRVVQADLGGVAFVTPSGTILLRLTGQAPRIDAGGVVSATAPAAIYGIVSQAGGGLGAPPGAEALVLPPDLDPRLAELAARLAAGEASAETRITRTSDYLGRECRYSLKVGAFRTKQPVAEFLFDKKRGYCEYFASAAAVLLRLQGVPARYLTGFNLRDDNAQGDHYVVREGDAHAWIEAWVPGRGWVEADPTPSAQYGEVHSPVAPGALAAAVEAIAAWFAVATARLAAGDGGALARPAVAVVVLATAVRWLRRRTPRKPGARAVEAAWLGPELRALLEQADAAWAGRGFRRPLGRAPLEHLESIPREALPDAARGALRDAVLGVYAGAFGGVPLPPNQVRALVERLRSGA